MIELVIKIPEEEYELVRHGNKSFLTELRLMNAVADGTPLPKGHGRLIDAAELDECVEMMTTIDGESKYAIRTEDIINMSTILDESEE